MSFSAALKTEILENKPLKARYKQAFAYGLFLFSKSFSPDSVLIATENPAIFKAYLSLAREIAGQAAIIQSGEKTRGGRTVYTASLPALEDRLRLLSYFSHTGYVNEDLTGEQEQACAFLSGAYLACGNITDPEKSYHLEFTVKDRALCDRLRETLDSCLPGAKTMRRRGGFSVYYKEYAQIEDLLAMMGAPKACLSMIDTEMMKHVRNNANRATNCETANIDKMVDAARSRACDIRLVTGTLGEDALPEDLREIAALRLKYPDASIKELGALLVPPLSKSGVYHRLARISKLAEEIK